MTTLNKRQEHLARSGHSPRLSRFGRGMTSIAPSRPLYGTVIRCECAWTFKTNEAPANGGNKECLMRWEEHVASIPPPDPNNPQNHAYSLPTTPCSVVWYDGHPWVLDGEPGVPTTRHWIGICDRYGLFNRTHIPGSIGWATHDEMAKQRPAVIYRDPGTAGA